MTQDNVTINVRGYATIRILRDPIHQLDPGGCPVCGGCDATVRIGDDWHVCDRHRVRWSMGNIEGAEPPFCWEQEREIAGYTEVKPIYRPWEAAARFEAQRWHSRVIVNPRQDLAPLYSPEPANPCPLCGEQRLGEHCLADTREVVCRQCVADCESTHGDRAPASANASPF